MKIKKASSWWKDMQQTAQAFPAAQLTVDALRVIGDVRTAVLLGRIWQQISNVEIRCIENRVFNGYETQGDEIAAMGWELVRNQILGVTPQYGYTDHEVEFSVETNDWQPEIKEVFWYDHGLLIEALIYMRQSILGEIYDVEQEENAG
jgi:hypothetical protein